MLKTVGIAMVAVAALTQSAMAACGSTVLEQNFNQYGGNYRLYSTDDAKNDFPVGKERAASNGEVHKAGLIFIKGQEGRGDRVSVGQGNLRALHPKDCVGTNECGTLFTVRLPEPLESATLSYKFKFQSGYSFARGGKLPGLCDEDCPTGCTSKDDDGGWSGRVHWREGGWFTSYMYLPGGTQTCGKDVCWGAQADPGKWMDMKVYYKMNSPGKSDGVQKVWLDGVLVQHTINIVYDNTGKHRIDRLKFDNFHGGSSAPFAPDHDQYVWFDDVSVREGECAPSGASRSLPASQTDDYKNLGAKHGRTGDPCLLNASEGRFPGTVSSSPDDADSSDDSSPPEDSSSNDSSSSGKDVDLVGAFSGQCAAKYGRCHGPVADDRRSCCSASDHCVRKEEHYGQCRPVKDSIPSGWTGTILTYGGSTSSSTSDDDHANKEDTSKSTTSDNDGSDKAKETATSSGKCAAKFARCGGSSGSCCSSSNHCVVKDAHYSQCRPVSDSIPDGWKGNIITADSGFQTSTSTTTTTTTTTTTPKTTTSTTPSPSTCAGKWKSCSASTKCCNAADHCVKKDRHYAQCRTKTRDIPDGWDGAILG